MIYSYLGIFRVTEKVHWRLAIILMIALFAMKPLFSCFLIGYLIAEFNKKYGANYLINILGEKNELFLIMTFFLTAVVSTFFRADDHVDCLFASIIVLSISLSKIMQSFFTNGLSSYLGRISYPFYLIQIPIICSWSSYLYLKIPELGIDIISANIINLFLTILLCLLLATTLLPIEKLSVTYSKKIANLLLN
jgi:peptidoglycan/LPS O-acetylase OafA/YrhL